MEPDRLYNDPGLAQFYDVENAWADDDEYCKSLAKGRSSILDLGCGTGLFAATAAQSDQHLVVGVDPARPMLDIAGRRPGGKRVHWVQDDARTIWLSRSFDLVVLTGHAFQVFLTPEDRAAVLRTIASHLAPEGRFVFDSRNPAAERWKTWTPAGSRGMLAHPQLGRVAAWNDVERDPATGIVTYQTCYEIVADGRVYSSVSKIAFPSREELALGIDEAGLTVDTWLGDWEGRPCTPTAPEIIPIGGLQRT
jgi:SAM-dependent methyltransferase